jgi:hypothetical protein
MVELPDIAPSDELIAYLEERAATASDWLAMSSALHEREQASGDIQAGWLMTAFDYDLAWRGRERSRPAFGSKWEIGGDVYPIPIAHVPDEVVALWRNVFDKVSGPIPRARLGHLLFERAGGVVGRAAADAYLEVGTSTWDRIERVTCMDWAADLARRVRAPDVIDRVVPALIDLARDSLAAAQAEPGVSLYAISLLIDIAATIPEIPGLLASARAAYPDAWLTSDTIRLQERIAKGDAARVMVLHREEVESHLRHADEVEGLARLVALQEAGAKATEFGLADLRDRAVGAMQAMTPDDLGLKPFSTTIEVPVDDIEAVIDAYVSSDTLLGALARLVAGPPPTGPIEANRDIAARRTAENPLTAIIPTTRLGRDGLPQMQATTDEEQADDQLAQVEAIRIGLNGPILAQALSRILAKFDPSEAELTNVFGDGVAPGSTRGLVRALLRFHGGDVEGAAFSAAPRIEAFLRTHLRAAGVPIFSGSAGPDPWPVPAARRAAVNDQGPPRPILAPVPVDVPGKSVGVELPQRAPPWLRR